MFDALSSGIGHVKAGKIRGIAVTSSKRSQAMPNVPTVAESGIPGFEAIAWYGVIGPSGVPKEIVNKINTAIVKVLNIPSVKERVHSLGYDTIGDSPEEFMAFIKAEMAKWGKVVKETGARPE
jgi:tripartite-type tricarboxylate transporter receptor subunit TctC